MKRRIEFKFNVKKLINALAFFAGEITDLDKLKAAKLLYFADKHHLVRYGRPILGDCYCALDAGPIPSRSLDIMKRIISQLCHILTKPWKITKQLF